MHAHSPRCSCSIEQHSRRGQRPFGLYFEAPPHIVLWPRGSRQHKHCPRHGRVKHQDAVGAVDDASKGGDIEPIACRDRRTAGRQEGKLEGLLPSSQQRCTPPASTVHPHSKSPALVPLPCAGPYSAPPAWLADEGRRQRIAVARQPARAAATHAAPGTSAQPLTGGAAVVAGAHHCSKRDEEGSRSAGRRRQRQLPERAPADSPCADRLLRLSLHSGSASGGMSTLSKESLGMQPGRGKIDGQCAGRLRSVPADGSQAAAAERRRRRSCDRVLLLAPLGHAAAAPSCSWADPSPPHPAPGHRGPSPAAARCQGRRCPRQLPDGSPGRRTAAE